MRHTALALAVLLVAASACADDSGGTTDNTAPATTTATTSASATEPADSTPPVTEAPVTQPPATDAPVAVVSDVRLERDEDGALIVRFTSTTGSVVVRSGDDDQMFDTEIGTTDVDGPSEMGVSIPDRAGRVFVQIDPVGGEPVTVAERRVVMEGVPNFRDLGGYETADGRRVRWGQVYRSGALFDLTDADYETAAALGIKLVCDLRSDSEVATEPDPDLGAEAVRLSVNDESVDVQAITNAILAGDLDQVSPTLLLDGMPRIATEFDDLWADLVRRVSDPANRPTNVHCSAGKDRAGWASAMLLRALGVPEEVVLEDYLLSNEYLAESNDHTLDQVRTIVAGVQGVPEADVDLSNLEALLEVRAEYLQAAFDAVDAQYGSFDAYLTDGLGLTTDEIEALRDSLLE